MTRILLRAAAAAASLSLFLSAVNAQTSTSAAAGTIQTLDCYSAIPSDFTNRGAYTFQTGGYCQTQCAGFSVMATTDGSTCLCGNELPTDDEKTSSSNCQSACQGYDQEKCGGTGFYQLYLTGQGTPGAPQGGSSSSAQTTAKAQTTTATTAVPSVVTQSGKVVTVTAAPTTATSAVSSSSSSSNGGGNSKVAIAVGVVVGVVGIAAIAGALLLFLKRRRRLAIEEEHRRSAAVSKFVNGAKSETSSTTDARLDPAVFSHRRNSLGSIADEQDFSRRILQVR